MSATSTTPGTSAGRRALPGRTRYSLCIGVAVIWLLLDQATKVLALKTLAFGQPVDSWLPLVEWQLVTNPNAAFGIPGFTGMFVLVTILVLVLIGRALPRTDRLSLAFAYGLVSGGALGNAFDRLFRANGFPDGEVVDFISLGFWPTFNIADVGIVVGAALVVVLLLRSETEDHERAGGGSQSVRPTSVPAQPRDGGERRGYDPLGSYERRDSYVQT